MRAFMRETSLKLIKKAKLVGLGLIFILAACVGGTGGGGGPAGGPGGGALDAANPLSGSGQAASGTGPVAMPAPDTIAYEPYTWEPHLISCTNVPGPKVDCRGDHGSVGAGAKLRLSVYPPAQPGGTPIGPSFQVTADPTGSWEGSVFASAGQIIGICLLQGGNCIETLYLPVPPEGGTVNGTQGIMKNMVVDPDGNIIYSQRRRKKPSSLFSFHWKSLFISEAHAEGESINVVDSTLFIEYIRNNPQRFIGFFDTSGGGEPEPPRWTAAECPDQPARVLLRSVGDIRQAQLPGNEAYLKRLKPGAASAGFFQEVIAEFPGYTREDIRAVEVVDFLKAGAPGQRENFIAAAVASHVYLVKNGDHPNIVQRFDFPDQFVVVELFNASPYLYVFLKPKDGGAKPEYPVYIIGQREGQFNASCTPRSEALSHLTGIYNLDGYLEKFAAIGETKDGKYNVIIGSPEVRSDLLDFPPLSLLEKNHPMEVKILDLFGRGTGLFSQAAILAVLDPIEKNITLIRYRWASAPDTAQVEVTSLGDLGLNNLSYPQMLAIDRANKKLAFLDIREGGSELVSIGYNISGDEVSLVRDSINRYAIGLEAPSFLRLLEGSWVYNNSRGEVKSAPPVVDATANGDAPALDGITREDLTPGTPYDAPLADFIVNMDDD